MPTASGTLETKGTSSTARTSAASWTKTTQRTPGRDPKTQQGSTNALRVH